MYYKLKPGYVLRGWKGSAWMLVKRPENQVWQLTHEKFQALLLCDGKTELPGNLLDKGLEEVLAQCEKVGWVETCIEPCPLENDQYYHYYPNRYVRNVFWSITGKCNYRCRHCFMDAPEAMLGELSTEQALDLIDQMADCGVLRVDITGGEPFVRKDFWQLIDRIRSYKMVIGTVYSNGWLLNEKVLDEFEKRHIKPAFSISFDGVGWHDWMRGIPGAEEAALRALKLCQDRGFPTDVEMCIHRGNVHTLPQTIKLLRKVGVEYVQVGNVQATEPWKLHNDGNSMDIREYMEEMLPYITWYYQEGQPIERLTISNIADMQRNAPCNIIPDLTTRTKEFENLYMCGAVRMSCYITPEGRLLPCMPMTASPQQDKFPLVQDIGLRAGLSDSYYMQFVNGRIKDLLAANPECAACEYRFQCGGGCRASALLEGDHDLMGCDRVRCLMWKEGYVDRIRQIADEAVAKYGGPMEK